jgi:hypothetical protein
MRFWQVRFRALRAPDKFLLTKPNTFQHNREARFDSERLPRCWKSTCGRSRVWLISLLSSIAIAGFRQISISRIGERHLDAD